MFLIFWIVCIYFYVRVIRFSLKEIPKIKEYRKTMSKKEAKKKIKSERTKRDKLDSVLAVVFLFLAMVSSPNSGNKTETAEKKEVKKVEDKKEEVKKEEPKAETRTTSEVDKPTATKEQKRLVEFLENADNRYFDNFKEILGAFDKQDSDKAKRLLNRYKDKLKEVYNNVLDYECKPTESLTFDKECRKLTQLASEEYTLKNNIINGIEDFFDNPNQMTLDNVRNQFMNMVEKKQEVKDGYIIFKNKKF